MRLVIAALIFTCLPLADAQKPGCGDHCSTVYSACMNHAKSKQARKTCKANFKNCKGTCNR